MGKEKMKRLNSGIPEWMDKEIEKRAREAYRSKSMEVVFLLESALAVQSGGGRDVERN